MQSALGYRHGELVHCLRAWRRAGASRECALTSSNHPVCSERALMLSTPLASHIFQHSEGSSVELVRAVTAGSSERGVANKAQRALYKEQQASRAA